MNEPLFTPEPLETLRAQAAPVGDEIVREVADEALRSIETCMAKIRAAESARNLEDLRSAAHRVKSVLAQVGALKMAAAAKTLEASAQAGDERAFSQIAAVLALSEPSCEALRAFATAPA